MSDFPWFEIDFDADWSGVGETSWFTLDFEADWEGDEQLDRFPGSFTLTFSPQIDRFPGSFTLTHAVAPAPEPTPAPTIAGPFEPAIVAQQDRFPGRFTLVAVSRDHFRGTFGLVKSGVFFAQAGFALVASYEERNVSTLLLSGAMMHARREDEELMLLL